MKATRYALMIVFLLSSASTQEKPDFSGLYLFNPPKVGKHEEPSPPSYLRVTQTERSMEATFSQAGQARTSRYFLDGSPSKNTTPGGGPSKDTARLKGKALVIESVIPAPGTVLHMKQKWQLSRGSQTLTIHSPIDGTSLGITIDLLSLNEVYSRQP